MKITTTKKLITGYIVAFMLFTTAMFAQNVNLSGTYEGLRQQWDPSHEYFMADFEYKFELEQQEDKVFGTSTIVNQDGDYAEVAIRGVVIGDKFYFEEYEIKDEMRPYNRVWCYKTGVLDIVSKDGETRLQGETESYMSTYKLPCTGGVTDIVKTDGKPICEGGECLELAQKDNETELGIISFNAYPNPFYDATAVEFTVEENVKAQIAVYDVSGRKVADVFKGKITSGTHKYEITELADAQAGMYIVKVTVGDKVFSRQLIKVQ